MIISKKEIDLLQQLLREAYWNGRNEMTEKEFEEWLHENPTKR